VGKAHKSRESKFGKKMVKYHVQTREMIRWGEEAYKKIYGITAPAILQLSMGWKSNNKRQFF
jgi:hypothetical protein